MTDFIFFGDLGAVDFYKKLNSADKAMRNKYLSYVKSSAVNSELEQTNKFSLQMFYTAELENVYYSEKSDCFIVADIENNNVYLHSVLYKNYIPLFKKTYTLFLTKPNSLASFKFDF